MLALELSSIILEFPKVAYTALCQHLIGCSTLSQEFCKLIGWYWKIMRWQLWTLTYPNWATSVFPSHISGGSLGLWMGWSMLTIFEFGELLVDLMVFCCAKLRGDKHKRTYPQKSSTQIQQLAWSSYLAGRSQLHRKIPYPILCKKALHYRVFFLSRNRGSRGIVLAGRQERIILNFTFSINIFIGNV